MEQTCSLVRRASIMVAVGAGAAAAVLAQPAGWQPNEFQVSSERQLIDPEISQSRAQFAWVDALGQLWLGKLNRSTGLFDPPDGRGQLLDTDVMTFKETAFAFNGPEWAYAARGDELAYTKFLPNTPHTRFSARIGLARQAKDGTWSAGFLSPDVPRYVPFGSETLKDRAPTITYLDDSGNHYWRETGRSNSERPVVAPIAPFTPIRTVRGARAAVLTVAVDGVKQLHRYELDTEALQQLTDDAGDKLSPWMWQAPEFGNAFVMAAVVNGGLRFYRELPAADGTLKWLPFHEAVPPAGHSVQTPEPFTYGGRSYLFMGMAVSPQAFSSAIWITGIDPARPEFRRISPAEPQRVRGDPEVFITRKGPRIYFNRYLTLPDPDTGLPVACWSLPPTDGSAECAEGVWLADPGIVSAP